MKGGGPAFPSIVIAVPATSSIVIAGLDPAIHADSARAADLDARIESAHDEGV